MDEILQKTDYMLKVIFEDMPWMVALTTLENEKFLKTNKLFEEITGFPKEELIGRTVGEAGIIIKPFEKRILLQKMKEPGSVKNFRAVLRGKNGDTVKGVFSLCQFNYNNEDCLLYVISDIIPPKQKKNKNGHSSALVYSDNSCC